MLQTLEYQVKDQTKKRQQSKSSNPEESSFKFINHLFR
jgi:hypothetical protein